MRFRYIALATLLLLGGCLTHVTQQGNVLKPDLITQISVGDSRFHVQDLLGTPVLQDTLHPHRAIYIDDYHDPDSSEKYRRKIDIVYDDAWRVKSIQISGFDKPKQKAP